MNILRGWQLSLVFFKPANLMVYLWSVLKSIVWTYKQYLKNGWPFWLTVSATALAIEYLGTDLGVLVQEYLVKGASSCDYDTELLISHKTQALKDLAVIATVLIFVGRFLAFKYVWSAKKFVSFDLKAFWWSSLVVFMFKVAAMVAMSFLRQDFFAYAVDAVWAIWLIFSLFFLLSSKQTLVSLLNALWLGLKMILYNIPYVVVLSALIALLYTPLAKQLGLLGVLLFPVIVCFIEKYYTREIRNKPHLYVS